MKENGTVALPLMDTALKKGELLIAEDEVDVIRTIFDRYIHTNDGVSGVAKYLNRQGFVKKLRQNGTIPGFSASFVKSIIDNPVYMGKIAYGRRRTEKKIGTRNEMHVVEQSEFPIYEDSTKPSFRKKIGIWHRKSVRSIPLSGKRSTIQIMHTSCPAF